MLQPRVGLSYAPDLEQPAEVPASSTAAAGRVVDGLIRLMDVTLAMLTLVVLSALLLAIAVAIWLDSRGPVIFKQRRVGKGGRILTVYKFRTMRADSTDAAHRVYARKLIGSGGQHPPPDGLYKLVDARITRVGRLLRRSSLDELPQLWNVVRGEMSLVGPRPVVTYEVELYPDWYHERFRVLPGLTGLWQVSGRSRLSYEQMVQHDIEFVTRRSVWLYLSILVRTVPAVLFRRETA